MRRYHTPVAPLRPQALTSSHALAPHSLSPSRQVLDHLEAMQNYYTAMTGKRPPGAPPAGQQRPGTAGPRRRPGAYPGGVGMQLQRPGTAPPQGSGTRAVHQLGVKLGVSQVCAAEGGGGRRWEGEGVGVNGEAGRMARGLRVPGLMESWNMGRPRETFVGSRG